MKKKMSLQNSLTFALLFLTISIAGCSGVKIHSSGIRHVQLGDPMPPKGISEFHQYAAKDTLFSDNGFDWRVVKVAYPQGIVWIESAVDNPGNIGRIRIETPTLKVKKGIQTGESAPEVFKYASEWRIRPFKEYKLLEATSPQFPHLYFLFTASHLDFEGELPEDFSTAEIPQSALLQKIVVL